MDLLNKLTSAFNASDKLEKEDDSAATDTPAVLKHTRNNDVLKSMLNNQPAPLKTGDVATGTLIGRGVATIFVDLGAKGTGIIFGREFYQAQDLLRGINKGDNISGKVVDPDNDDGYVELSVKDAGREMVWQRLDEHKKLGTNLKVKITAANRGGLVAQVEGMQAFLPVSQLSATHYPRVEGGDKDKIYGELQKFVGQEFEVQILDFSPQEQKLILSEKAVEKTELSGLLKDYKVGDMVEGTVSGIVDFGIFLRFGPDDRLEGLAHISELDWQMVQDPGSLFGVGEKIKAKIIEIADGRVSLSVKALKPDPWQDIAERFPKGAEVGGKVIKFSPFGAFVELAPNIQALIHISEFGNEMRMKEVLELDKTFNFRVASIDSKEHRMSLKLAKEEEQQTNSETVKEDIESDVKEAKVQEVKEKETSQESTEQKTEQDTGAQE
ncbi:MAG: hypothetical protein A3A80_00400 [Candidatus Terrybacteria bacterium RIFCSPLOWO2_01_FULL_44_24]|uniref:S1 motif domain-containing protein n=1 Tax=Candidatus Terrybacteria bacterium RIFCSPHIGHO2_01_FULL_43_35 TaxID=1802361 RepID=A0A1G2PED6_9BACT|nr:MAG: hypothetical protein A2828_00870 [Candidatus Terrybacteria bacterium RIFCSPHIGHO2_01_FULL_43_35]OHA51962.1 MAG: hypothetical protein A3A80_00400 [Candidatus Terrybacteria bacterium RIFCSPLOWO2_01_FULL_44_24]